jgi:HEAT repeat protein
MICPALLVLCWQASALGDELTDLIGRLKDSAVRHDVVNALVQIGPTVVPAVIDAMQDSANRELHVGALMTLVAFGRDAKGALPVFTKGLNDRDDTIRQLSAQGLAVLGKQAVGQVDQLSKLLRDDSSESVRFQAAFTLRYVDPEGTRSVPELAHALGDKSPEVRSAAARALGELGPKAMGAVAGLVACLRDQGIRLEMYSPDNYGPREVRVDVAEALDRICGGKGYGTKAKAQAAAGCCASSGISCQCAELRCCSRQQRRTARSYRRCR